MGSFFLFLSTQVTVFIIFFIIMKMYDKITVEEARKIYEEAKMNEKLSEYNFPTKPSTDGYYHIQIPDSTKKSGYVPKILLVIGREEEVAYKFFSLMILINYI